MQDIGINIFLRVETFDGQIADLDLLTGVKLGQLASRQDLQTLERTVTVANIAAGIVGVVVDRGSGNIVDDLFQYNRAAVAVAEVEEVFKVIPMLMRNDPCCNDDLAVFALVQSLQRIVKLGFVLAGGTAAVMNDEATVFQGNDERITKVSLPCINRSNSKYSSYPSENSDTPSSGRDFTSGTVSPLNSACTSCTLSS